MAILISGRGSNMEALIKAANSLEFPAEIVGVISNKADAVGLKIASDQQLPIAIFSLPTGQTRTQIDLVMTEQLQNWHVDIVCLAGFMRILSDGFVQHWMGRMINIHPSLLPGFRGINTHQRVLDAGETEHGCSVHFVVPELDAGPFFAQAKVAITPGDTAKTLAERVLKAEHALYPQALKQLASGKLRLLDGQIVHAPEGGFFDHK